MAENPKPPTSSEMSTPAPNPAPPRRSRPRVREVSSRFMSPVTSPSLTSSSLDSQSAKSPLNPNPRSLPSTPSHSHLSRAHHNHHHYPTTVRRSNSVQRHRYGDENRPDSINRSSVSPVRNSKPRSAVKLFKDCSRIDTPVVGAGPTAVVGSRLVRHRTWDTAASKLLQANGMSDDGSSVDGDCESVKSEPCDNVSSSTPMSRSMELTFSGHENRGSMHTSKVAGGNDEKMGGGGAALMMRSCSGSVKVARSLNLPPMPPPHGGSKPQGTMDVKKALVRKESTQQDDVQRLKLLHNNYLQWRFANAKAEAAMIARKRESEKQLYSLGVKISKIQDSVKSKRAELGCLQRMKTLSNILDTEMPFLDEWSALEEEYSSSLLALTQGLLNVSSQLPLSGNVRADVKEIGEALNWASKAVEMIFSQVQSFMPKAEQVDCLISDLARVCSGEVALVEECGDLLSKTHLSQVEECSLRGQVMQFHRFNLDQSKEEQA